MRNLSKIFVCFAIILLTSCNPYGQKITYDQLEIYYKDGITKEEASKAGDYIIHSGMITDLSTKKTIQLKKEGSTFVLSMVVSGGMTASSDFMNAVLNNTVLLSQNVFNGSDVRTDLCDDHLKTYQSVKMTDWQQIIAGSYEIKFPLWWKAVAHDDEYMKFIIFPATPENAHTITSVELNVTDLKDNKKSIDDITQALMTQVKNPSYLTNVKITELGDAVSNGEVGKKMIVTGTLTEDNTNEKIEYHYWLADGKLYALHGFVDVNQTNQIHGTRWSL